MGGRRVEHDLGAVEPERTPPLGEVPVVTDVDAHLADGRVEDRISTVPGFEVELLPEALHLRDVLLAVLAEVRAVGVDDRSGVVVHARLLDLVHRQDQHHVQFRRQLHEPLRGGTIGDVLGVLVVLGILHLAEVRAVEQLLEAHDLRTLGGCFTRRLLVLDDHRLLVAGPIGLQ